MKTIGIFTGDWGHKSIAQAVVEKIEQKTGNKYRIKTFFCHKQPLAFAYDSLYRFSPSSLGPSFHIVSNIMEKDKNIRKLIESWFISNNEKEIRSFIKKNKVDIAISTYFECNPTLEKIQTEGIPLIIISTDPKTIHPMVLSKKAKANLVFDDFVIKHYKNKNMIKSGWFVRNKFEENYDKKIIRKKLKINDNLTVLVVSGSEGANAVLKILPSIINCNKKVNFIIACGKNEFLYNNTIGIQRSLKNLSSSQAKIIPLGYTEDLHLYMQAADLVIGKAGPNTLFESIACETPFFAITHISGQEDGNLEIIKEYKIGIVEENTKRANQKLDKLIANPKQLESFSLNIRKLKKYNQNSIEILLKEIEKVLQ